MSRKKVSGFEILMSAIMALVVLLITFVIKLIIFSYEVITFYTTGYHKKSGYGFFKTYFDKGHYGEFSFYRKLSRRFNKRLILLNVYLEGQNTSHTEIDMMVVSKKGIYVFEVKNYGGYIYGSASDVNWTQVLTKRHKFQFYNPLRQNYAHTKAVEKYLGVDEKILIPMVVFSNRSKLRKLSIEKHHIVNQFNSTLKLIKKLEKKAVDVLTEEEVSSYLSLLIEKTLMSDDVKEAHISEVRALRMTSSKTALVSNQVAEPQSLIEDLPIFGEHDLFEVYDKILIETNE